MRLAPGDVALAEPPPLPGVARRKKRPAVLVRDLGRGRWLSARLTAVSEYANGLPRIPVPNPQVVGLNRPASWIWGGGLVEVERRHVTRVVGRVDGPLVAAIWEKHRDVTCEDAVAMLTGGS